MPVPDTTASHVAAIYQAESRRVLATLIRLLGDFDQAEEALQEAFRAALETWPRTGIPRNPRAWLISTGRFKALDASRRERRGEQLLRQAALDAPEPEPDAWDDETVHDDQLRLIFTCCHPLLGIEARIALALREVCGLSTEETARAFLVSVDAMKKRIARAKATIRARRIPYEIPSRAELAKRLEAVLQVVYLVYNEGYAATAGDALIRRELTGEAVSVARLVAELIPEPEAIGLLALLVFHESRSNARTDAAGDLIGLDDQDRSAWDRQLIDEGLGLTQRAMFSGRWGPYTVQAGIASVHAVAPSVRETNWPLIVEHYDRLLALHPSPVVRLNRGIAIGMRDGPAAGLRIIEPLVNGGALAGYHPAHSARADLARRSGMRDIAASAYRRALELVQQEPERRYLQRQLDTVT